ncbi:GDSL esterase/lipase 7 [Vitis vinifera]|uniref:GDSL esterase/lipase 7 n=1 Tax=Vitis vinifera TaxID=29760 RepID=A0A438IMS3_VITVI|nr:GDSL esterase/lipase 7 [Vitis vinifera]
MSTSTTLLAFSLLLPLLLISPSQASTPPQASFPKRNSGNNNFLKALAKANYSPYGSTFFGKPTGRFTDGRTAADFIGTSTQHFLYSTQWVALSTSLSRVISRAQTDSKTGVNFASGSSGILPHTGAELRKEFKNQAEFSQYLSKAVFYISTGSNDYGLGYLFPQTGLSQKFTDKTFAQLLSQQLTLRLQEVLVNNVGAIGCTPASLNFLKPSTPCDDSRNSLVSVYNDLLPAVLSKLQAELPGSKFVVSNIFKFFLDIKASPATFHITDTRNNCCVDAAGNGTTQCKEGQPPCKDVKTRLFFDAVHPTQSVHYLLVRRCFSDPTICAPMNLGQLMGA